MDSHYQRNEKYFPWKLTFQHIKTRCTNPNRNNYKDYGGRGIQCLITEEELKELWFRDKAHNMKQATIDRKDNDGNYEYDNCRYIEKGKNSAERNIRVSSRPISQYALSGKLIKRWKSTSEAAKVLQISRTGISNCLLKRTKTSSNFKWEYIFNLCNGCHMKLEKPLLFCSITCACLAGYMSVRSDFVPKHTMEELANSKELRDKLLNNDPVRVRERHPCKCHHTKEEREEMRLGKL